MSKKTDYGAITTMFLTKAPDQSDPEIPDKNIKKKRGKAGRPKKEGELRTKKLALAVEPSFLAMVDKAAKERGMTVTALVRDAIERYIEQTSPEAAAQREREEKIMQAFQEMYETACKAIGDKC